MVDAGKLEICDRHSRRPSKFRVSDREESFDRLSDLPDALLLQILSYFSLDDAITTSLLSRRWRNLWKWMDNLDFPMQCGKSKRNSLQFIERSLSLHEGIKIKRFCARFRYNSNFISHVDSWVRFAVVRNVEKLVLDPFYVENGVQPYVIPVNLYKCGSLKELEVNLCRFSPPPSFLLGSLTKLTINNTVFAGDTLKTLISGCPALEELELVNCNQARNLEVVVLNRNLERMKIVEFPDEVEEGTTELKIYAPYLLHLELQSGDLRPCVIQDASSIVSVWLDLRKMVTCLSFNAYNQKNYCKILVNIMIGLHEVKTLRLSYWCVQALLAQEDLHNCLPTTLQSLKHLKLDVQLTKEELPGIACLLRSSPELESLNIQLCRQAHMDKDMIDPTDSNRSEWSFWDKHESTFHCLKYNLKKVIIENFKGEENEMRFLAFLLRKSIVLKKLVISMSVQPLSFAGSGEAYVEYCSKPGRASKKYLQSIRKLMEYPRPPQAEILFFGSQPACF